jgi:hypothetical protein
MTKISTKYFIATPNKSETIDNLSCINNVQNDVEFDLDYLDVFELQDPSNEVVERILLFASQYDAL